jgi:hypothetical protein
MLSTFYSKLSGRHSNNEVHRATQDQKPAEPTRQGNHNSQTKSCLEKLNCRSTRRDSVIIYNSKITNIKTTVASTPLFSPLKSPEGTPDIVQPFHYEVSSVRDNETAVKEATTEETNEVTDINSFSTLNIKQESTCKKTLSIGSKILLSGGVILSGIETYLILVSEDKDKSDLTRWGLVAGGCLGPLLVTTETGSQIIRKIAAEAGFIVTAQGIFVNLFGWRSPMGQLIQALTSPFIVSSVFSANLTLAIARKTSKKSHARSVSDSKNLIGGVESQAAPNTFKQTLLANRISLLASSALIAGGSIGWYKSENSFYYDILSQSAIRLGTIITSKVFSHYFLDAYFFRHKNFIAPTASFISSILLSEVVSGAVGPIPTILLMSGLGTVLAADQTIKTHHVFKKIKLMKALKEFVKKNPEFVNALKDIVKILRIAEPENSKSKFGFTKTNKRVFGILIGLVIASPFLSEFSGLAQFSVAYLFLASYFYGSNYFRLNSPLENLSPRSCSRKMVEKIFINPFRYISTISLYPQTLLWGYYVNHVWAGAYRAIGETNDIPDSISYGVTPGDFALFFGTLGGLYSRRYTPIEWDKISENGLKMLIRFLKNEGVTKDYELAMTKDEIAYLAKMSQEKDAKQESDSNELKKIVVEPKPLQIEGESPVPHKKPWLRIGYHDNKIYCQILVKKGFFSKQLKMNVVPRHDMDITESTKLLYTAMWPDVIRLAR